MADEVLERVLRSSNDFAPYRRFHRASSLLGHSEYSVVQVIEELCHEENSGVELAGVLLALE